jgi:hypothetical protein
MQSGTQWHARLAGLESLRASACHELILVHGLEMG